MAPDPWWQKTPAPEGPSEVNKYVDRCLEHLLTPDAEAPVRKIVAQSLRPAGLACSGTRCDACGNENKTTTRIRNPYCTSHVLHLCSGCWAV